jgi:hypothetical protein
MGWPLFVKLAGDLRDLWRRLVAADVPHAIHEVGVSVDASGVAQMLERPEAGRAHLRIISGVGGDLLGDGVEPVRR